MVRLMNISVVYLNKLTGIPCWKIELEPRIKYEYE